MTVASPSFFQHPKSLVESDQIGDGTRIWAFAQVMEGAVVGKHCNVGGHAFVESGARIGDGVTIKNHVCIWDGVTIEDGAFIGPRVTFTNDLYPRSPRMADLPQMPPSSQDAGAGMAHRYESASTWRVDTTIRFGCSIGAGVTVVPGVTLGVGCMIGAGSLVTKDVPPFALMVGSPARKIGEVCLCGQKVSGPFAETTCSHCGQTGAQREQLLRLATSEASNDEDCSTETPTA